MFSYQEDTPMNKPKKDSKHVVIGVRSTTEYKDRVAQIAQMRGKDMSDYVREALDAALERDAMRIGLKHA
jgi:uncharacterized protein (DUF1778 family)